MKKYIVCALIAVMLLSLTACRKGVQINVEDSTENQTTLPATEPVESSEPEQTQDLFEGEAEIDFSQFETEPSVTEPDTTDPVPTEPEPTEPAPTETTPNRPQPTEPAPSEPKPTEPEPTEPEPTEPEPTETEPTEPAPTVAPATEPDGYSNQIVRP